VIPAPAHQHLGRSARVGDGFRRKLLEAGLGQQHHINILGHDHAGGSLIGVVLVEAVAQVCEELDRCLQIAHRQVHKDVGRHIAPVKKMFTSQNTNMPRF
jgi:hypothetical protein